MDNIKEVNFVQGKVISKRSIGKNKPILRVDYNTVSNAAQNVMLSLSAGYMLHGGYRTPFNMLAGTTPGMYKVANDVNRYIAFYDYNNYKYGLGLTIFLLNLTSEEIEGLNANSKYIDIFDVSGNLSSKVVAYGTYKLDTANPKEGIVGYSDEESLIKGNSSGFAWVFPANLGAFEYNCIAVASFDSTKNFAAYKCINRVNLYKSGNTLTRNYIIPGAGSLTGANEIILDHTDRGISRWKYNMKTGITTAVESNEPGYSIDMTSMNGAQLVFDGKLYVIPFEISRWYHNYANRYLVIDTSNGSVLKDQEVSSGYYGTMSGLFTDGTNVYISFAKSSTTGGGSCALGLIDKSDHSISYTNLNESDLFSNWPEDFDLTVSTYIKASWVENDTRYYVVGDWQRQVEFIVSDPKNIKTSKIAESPIFDCVVNLDNTPEGTFFICGGVKKQDRFGVTNDYKIMRQAMLNVFANQYEGEEDPNITDYDKLGVWINNNKFSNFLSFKKYEAAESKTLAQQLTITYEYYALNG